MLLNAVVSVAFPAAPEMAQVRQQWVGGPPHRGLGKGRVGVRGKERKGMPVAQVQSCEWHFKDSHKSVALASSKKSN